MSSWLESSHRILRWCWRTISLWAPHTYAKQPCDWFGIGPSPWHNLCSHLGVNHREGAQPRLLEYYQLQKVNKPTDKLCFDWLWVCHWFLSYCVEWNGMEEWGNVSYGMIWYGIRWYQKRYRILCYGMEWWKLGGMEWYVTAWKVKVWYSMACWYEIVWYERVQYANA